MSLLNYTTQIAAQKTVYEALLEKKFTGLALTDKAA